MMILPQKSDATHRTYLYKILLAMFDNVAIAKNFRFKGGTCAAMLGYLDRFSVDLDFDYVGDPAEIATIRPILEKIFTDLGLEIKDNSKKVIQYFLKYPNASGKRNTISIDSHFPVPASNTYEPKRFVELDRTIICQTIETMFANKLAAVMDRYKKRGTVAGRDIYDIHHFLSKGYNFNVAVLEEHTGLKSSEYLKQLTQFVEDKVTSTILDQDLNHLLTTENFRAIRKKLKEETLLLLRVVNQ